MAGIVLSIEVDDKGSVKVKQFSDETKKAFAEMKKGPQEAAGSLNSLRDSWVGVTAKITAATAVIYGVSRALSSFVNEAAEAEQIENRLRFALETTGYTWQYAKSAVDQFANSVQESTRFSDEQARQALTDMMMYTNDFAKAQVGAKLAMDMSIRTGQDLSSTSRLIGMAMSGNVEMLGRYIPQLRNLDERLGSNATNAQKAEYAMKALNEKFGGTAQADVKTYAGILAQFKNQWSDLKEEIGYGLLPVLKETFGWLTKILKEMRDQRELMKEGGETGFWSQFKKPIPGMPYHMPLAQYEISAKARIEAYERSMLAAETKKDILPESTKIKEDLEKTILEYHKFRAEVDKLSEAGKMPSWEDSLWSYPKQTLPDVIALNLEFNKLIATAERLSAAGEMPDWRESLDDMPKGFAKIEGYMYRLQDIYESYDTEASQRVKDWVANWKTGAEQIQGIWETLSGNISSAWNFNVTGILRGTATIKDSFKNMVNGMVDSFINAITKMIAQWILFGSITGKKEAGGGFLTGGSWSGILGGIVGLFTKTPAVTAQEGFSGWVNKPTAFLAGEGGQREFINITPESKMKETEGGGVLIQNFIQVTDPGTYERLYGPVIKKLSGQSYAEAKRYNKLGNRS